MNSQLAARRLAVPDATAIGRFLESSEGLPLAYLPGLSREISCRAATESLLGACAADAHDVLAVSTAAGLEGIAVLQPSAWDSEVLARRAGRVAAFHVKRGESGPAVVRALLSELSSCIKTRGYEFVDMALPVEETAQLDAACAAGWRLVAVNMGIVWDLHRPRQRAANPATHLSIATPEDETRLVALASRAIDHHSRFAVDPGFSPEIAPRVFGAWARSLARGRAALIHLCWHGETLAGYCAWRLNTALVAHGGPKVAVLELTSVAPELRQQGVMSALIHGGLQHFQAEEVSVGEVYTHVLNGGMQRACILAGGMTRTARATLHWHARR